MKILLAAVNAKYIHSNLAVYCLRAYAKPYRGEITIAEYTINQPQGDILTDIYRQRPDLLCFSCYIWNIETVRYLIREVKKVLPGTVVWAGGPEVSYDSRAFLEEYPEMAGVMKGEGEETFLELLHYYHGCGKSDLKGITGITFRDGNRIVENEWRPVMDLSRVPFVYEDMDVFRNKIIYYESSRGCPFRCSYCLSSVDKALRFRDISLVKKELQFFLEQKVPQVKFVDRTFNCRHSHATEIWKYIKEHDNGITNFHFEISADLLNEEEMELMKDMRPGLIQLEIGVQSTNPDTILEIQRTMQFETVAGNVRRIHGGENIHQHLDLIAGLPFEDYESFGRSFDEVYDLEPQQLQLGFLKVLKGSYMEERRKEYGLVFQDSPPYEVLYTKWLPFSDVVRLKRVEEMVEVYYNSSQFTHTMKELKKEFAGAFAMYEALAEYYDRKGLFGLSHKRSARYSIVLDFVREKAPEKTELYRELLIYDFYLRENAKSRPDFAGEETVEKEWLRKFYDAEEESHRFLSGYEGLDSRQIRKMTHAEHFKKIGREDAYVIFDYKNRSPLNHDAAVCCVSDIWEEEQR